MEKTQKKPLLNNGEYKLLQVNELNFFDLTGQKAKNKGTSNKQYLIELHQSLKDNKHQIYTMYGPTGGHQAEDWRYYDNEEKARKDYESILKSKRKKGYKDIEVAQRAYGSEEAKKITKPVQFKNLDESVKPELKSKLDNGQKRLIEILFGAQEEFVVTTLKCPLGQLTNKQIDDGRDCLNQAKVIVNKRKLSKKDNDKLLDLTNDFYGLIPHNLGSGARGQMTHLLLDDLTKIMQKEDDLDTLLDAKIVGAQLKGESSFDAKYDTLKANIKEIDKNDDLFKFISNYFSQTKQIRHGFGSAKVKSIWSLERNNESEYFLNTTRKIAEKCNGHTFASEASYLSNNLAHRWIPEKRPDLDSKNTNLYSKANVWLCWHGTRSANLVGITTKGLLIRPSGAVHTGSMFGDGKYFSWQSSKSLNYSDGGMWTGRRIKNNSKFMFLLDVTFGNMYTAPRSHFYKGPPSGYHSVYGKANYSGVLNDEMITYDFKQEQTQSQIRYLLEIME